MHVAALLVVKRALQRRLCAGGLSNMYHDDCVAHCMGSGLLLHVCNVSKGIGVEGM